jgi:hypothetical protein
MTRFDKWAFRVMVVVLVAFGVWLVCGIHTTDPAEVKVRQEEQRQTASQSKADHVVNRIQYIRDPRTGLCFAYVPARWHNDGPALAVVPCESVPAHLLTTANVDDDAEE